MAVVWKAVMHGAAGFSRPVAVKKIKPEFRAIKNYIDMFVEEARVGSDLAHPNIVQVFDFCTDGAGAYYLVMEWVEGIDLGAFVRSFVARGERSHWPLVTAIGIGTLRGLAAAHERRRMDGSVAPVIHRDVSPHNILLGVNGTVKLSDFGLARARDRVYSLTAPGTVKGKLSYLSPELTAGRPASTATDIFSMGCVMWESLAGQRLFDAASDLEVFQLIRQGQIRPLAPERPDLSPRLVAAVHRALAVRPEDRFPSARAMALELAECLREHDVSLDAQSMLGTSVAQARESLGMDMAVDNRPTWSFSIDIDTGDGDDPVA
jgi:eukaryotic-like serine/threonine-protein kinase